jgi:hypothetical protein
MDIDDDTFDTCERDEIQQQFEQQLQWIDEEEEDILAVTALVAYGLEEAREHHREQRFRKRLYLVRGDLLPNPRVNTPWQKLYSQQNERAFITTM